MCLLLMPMVASVQSNAMGREITLNVGYTEPTINVSIRPRVPLRIPSLSIDGTTLYFDEAWQGHDLVIVGYNDDGYIAYDTDKKAGDYIIVPEEDVNGLYKVGIKKK